MRPTLGRGQICYIEIPAIDVRPIRADAPAEAVAL
jgi:hypothetical protein